MTDNLHLLLPEFILASLAIVVFAVDLFVPASRKNLLGWLSIVGLLAIFAFTVPLLWGKNVELYGGLMRADAYALFFKGFFLLMGVAVILLSLGFVRKYLEHPGEYYGIILFSILGMNVMAASGELLTAYISLELLSFSLYILVSFALHNPKSNEAGIKYILIGAFSSAILLYGISLIYGVVHTTKFVDISAALTGAQGVSPALWIGLALVLVGLGFKLAAVPFHMWAPDVYEGAPLPVTAYLAVGSKAAAMALVLRLFSEAFLPAADQWRYIVAVLAAFTMVVGNVVAIAQKNLKRLLAYSSIGQVGYLLVGIAGLSTLSSNGIMLHMVGYAFTNLAAFGAIIAFYNVTGKDDVQDLSGMADRHPFVALAISAAFFSLAGLPFFAGFTTKFYLFASASKEGFIWLAGLAIFMSMVSLYYYLNVLKQMYITPAAEGEKSALKLSPLLVGTVAVLVLGTFWVGVYPQPLVNAVTAATRAILPIS